MNVNGINNNNLIDTQSAAKITEDLFASLSKKTVDYSKVDLTKFNRQSLGVDFYNQRTDINFQRQIAITNSGLYSQGPAFNSVKLLNSLAASNAYAENTPQILGGRLTIDANIPEIELISQANEKDDSVVVVQTSDDKKGSNPFYYGEEQSANQNTEEI